MSQKGWSKNFDPEKNCQDASAAFCEDGAAVAAVADGHGGEAYRLSEFGARFACDAAITNIKKVISEKINKINKINNKTDAKLSDEEILQLKKSIINSWNEAVENDGRGETRAYGTTLIAAGAGAGAWFGIQIGDGRLLTFSGGEFQAPIPDDDLCVFNFTTSLCADDAIQNFRGYASDDLPEAIFLITDGVLNSFKNEEGVCELLRKFLISRDPEELKEFLPILTKKGSGDDVSIAGIVF
jgi:serine/threonine protein phosphatase PrpC